MEPFATYVYFTVDGLIYIQDPIHIGTKLRNRLLKASICLPFGIKAISITHLKQLLTLVPKDKHGLVMFDISPDDRQNFKSLQKIMDKRVLNLLKTHVINSEATILYLKICNNVTSSFLDQHLAAIDRIYMMWHAIFVLRIWKNFIIRSDLYNLEDNFISDNAFTCIEINGNNLIQLIITLRECGMPEMFLPCLFDSQTCERTFRQFRSMGTINWTRINFSLMELLHMVSRVDLQNDIIYDKLANIVKFPRVDQHSGPKNQTFEGTPNLTLPSNDEIMEIIKRARQDAIQCTSEFGMSCEEIDLQDGRLQHQKAKKKNE